MVGPLTTTSRLWVKCLAQGHNDRPTMWEYIVSLVFTALLLLEFVDISLCTAVLMAGHSISIRLMSRL